MKNLFLLLVSFLPLVLTEAQQSKSQLDIQLNKNILQPGDSLFVTVDYQQRNDQTESRSLATLEIIVENEQGRRTSLRWPVINGKVSGALYLPDALPHGKYTLLAGLQPGFFEVIGELKDAGKTGNIKAMLLTKNGDWDEQEVTVTPNGSFAIRNWLFEENALLAFSDTKNNNRPLNIRISTRLDSSYAPLAVAARAFYVGSPPSTTAEILNQPVEPPVSTFGDRSILLPAVIVRSRAKTRAEQFDDEHSSGMFRSVNERIISIMDDPGAIGSPNILFYLQGRVAGLQISATGGRWRGKPVSFFIDELRVPAQQLAGIPMTDIAIVKAFPPPFFGSFGSGGAIAVYTRRGGESTYLPAGSSVFRIKGYTPSAVALNMNRLNL